MPTQNIFAQIVIVNHFYKNGELYYVTELNQKGINPATVTAHWLDMHPEAVAKYWKKMASN